MEDQILYMEQLNWYLYRQAKANWEDTPANKRKGSPPKEPEPIFLSDKPLTVDRNLIPPDIGDTVPVEEN